MLLLHLQKPNNDLFEPQPKSPPPEVDPNRMDSSLLPSQLTPMVRYYHC